MFKLIVSDLHLGDGSPILDSFDDCQQTAFVAMLSALATPNGFLGDADEVELIFNGDCFDFLTLPPFATQRVTEQATALEKVERMIAAHQVFFSALESFVSRPGRSLTFLIGNHDVDLCFTEVRRRICAAIGVRLSDPRVSFCSSRAYRPLPDVYIEHGHQYDFMNHSTQDLWDAQGQPLFSHPQTMPVSIGTWYYQFAAHSVNARFPYFDHFEPGLSYMRQIAILCLFDPALVVQVAQRTMQMFSYPRRALAHLNPGEEQQPARLFEAVLLDFAAFREEMRKLKPDWEEMPQDEALSSTEMMEFMQIREALTLPPLEALRLLFAVHECQMGEIARCMHAVLHDDPRLRYAIAGHTHMLRADALNEGRQMYFNTGSWTARFALPSPDEITPALVSWLLQPDWHHIPLREVTQHAFVLLTGWENRATEGNLCVRDGDTECRYRVLG